MTRRQGDQDRILSTNKPRSVEGSQKKKQMFMQIRKKNVNAVDKANGQKLARTAGENLAVMELVVRTSPIALRPGYPQRLGVGELSQANVEDVDGGAPGMWDDSGLCKAAAELEAGKADSEVLLRTEGRFWWEGRDIVKEGTLCKIEFRWGKSQQGAGRTANV
jgi:hypothetical protein